MQAPFDECWRTVEEHRSDRMQGHFVHPFDDDHFISGNGTIGLEILEDLPDVDAVVAPLGGGGLLAGIACVMHSERPERQGLCRRTGNGRAAGGIVRRRAARARSTPGSASFVDGAGGRSVLGIDVAAAPRRWVSESLVVSLDDAARAMRLVADRVHVIAEGAAACAVAAAVSPAMAARGHKKVVAVVSGGNIDLKRFAELVGACGKTRSDLIDGSILIRRSITAPAITASS